MASTPYSTTTTGEAFTWANGVFGATSSSLTGFNGATPTAQYAAITSVATTGATSTSPFGFSTSAQADALVTAVNALILMARTKGLITT